MNLSGAASLHIFRAERNELSTSSLFMSGVYLEVLHASAKDRHINLRLWEQEAPQLLLVMLLLLQLHVLY